MEDKNHVREPQVAYAPIAAQHKMRIHQQGYPVQQIKILQEDQYFFSKYTNFQKGLSFGDIAPLITFLDYNQQDLAHFLDVNPSTISRWKTQDSALGMLRSKNSVEVDRIIAKGVRIFGSEIGFQMWLRAMNTALGDVKPRDLLKNPFEVETVDNALEALSWGSYL
jgi:putative toxin-antitoxin system antitoxin component (TIGR02293 family)